MTGCEGVCEGEYFHSAFPNEIIKLDLPIHALEMLAVLLAVRVWGHRFQGQKVQIYCDNEPVVHVINSSKTRDTFLATCLRELWLEVSKFGFELRAVHLPGVENRVADWLSRWDIHIKYKQLFDEFIRNETFQYREILITQQMFRFSGDL